MATCDISDKKCLRGISSYPVVLESTMSKIFSNEEMQRYMQVIERQLGGINIEVADCRGNTALWSWKKKSIKLDNFLLKGSEENKLGYLIFELFNALQTPEFERLAEKHTDVNQFVLDVEKLEHGSALKTKDIIPQILGENAEFDLKYVDPEFRYHYALDQISGHAEWLAKRYYPEQTYRGTLFHSVTTLDRKTREILYALLYCNNRKTQVSKKLDPDLDFDEIISDLNASASSDESSQKALDCANHLFFLK
jgi:hypothetical protein